MSTTEAQYRLLACAVQAWADNLDDDIGDGNDMENAPEMVDAGLKCHDSLLEWGPPLDPMEWRALEAAVELLVCGWPDEWTPEVCECTPEALVEAAATLGLTRAYFTGGGPRHGDT
jgi:hypothetical protein